MMSVFLVDKYDIKIVSHIRIDRRGLSLVLALKQFLNLQVNEPCATFSFFSLLVFQQKVSRASHLVKETVVSYYVAEND